MSANQEIENTNEVPRRRLLPRPNQVENPIKIPPIIPIESPVIISNRTPTPEKCRIDHYQKRLLSYNEIKGKICKLYFREESKSAYVQQMLEISTKRKFGKNAKYPNEKYCDVIKKDKRFIASLLQADMVIPETLRDYCVLSLNERYFK
jgi:hypothetical protein